MSNNMYQEAVKLTVVGDGATGKTSLLWNYTTDQAYTTYEPTIFDTMQCNVMYKDKPMLLNLFDSCGQEDYSNLRVLTYPQTQVFVLLYSVISPHSFDNISTVWLPEVRKHCPDVPILLVGSKVDLREDPGVVQKLTAHGLKPVTPEEGRLKAEALGCDGFIEVCSMNGFNVRECFTKALEFHEIAKQRNKKGKKRGGGADEGCACNIM